MSCPLFVNVQLGQDVPATIPRADRMRKPAHALWQKRTTRPVSRKFFKESREAVSDLAVVFVAGVRPPARGGVKVLTTEPRCLTPQEMIFRCSTWFP
jgi:hypothetical protein